MKSSLLGKSDTHNAGGKVASLWFGVLFIWLFIADIFLAYTPPLLWFYTLTHLPGDYILIAPFFMGVVLPLVIIAALICSLIYRKITKMLSGHISAAVIRSITIILALFIAFSLPAYKYNVNSSRIKRHDDLKEALTQQLRSIKNITDCAVYIPDMFYYWEMCIGKTLVRSDVTAPEECRRQAALPFKTDSSGRNIVSELGYVRYFSPPDAPSHTCDRYQERNYSNY